MSEEEISVLMEEEWLQRFGKVVRYVDGSVIQSRRMRLRSAYSHNEKYLMLMWHVRGVGFCALPIAVHPSLSS